MGKNLTVLMMGGQRVGKSSTLAAIIDVFSKPPINTILSASEAKQTEGQSSIKSKLKKAKKIFEDYNNKTILVDSGKTSSICRYNLSLSVPGSIDNMTISFIDVNGEFYNGEDIQDNQIKEEIKDCDVIVIAVDSTFLMGEFDENDIYVDDVVNHKYNCVDDIQSFLIQINLKDITTKKLVVFVPVKCEKWAKEGKLDLVVERTKEVYSTPIASLRANDNIQIEFIPVQTMGNIVFQEHLPATIFNWKESFLWFFEIDKTQKASPLQNGKIRLSDGKELPISSGTMVDDPECVLISGTDIVRPNSWFKVIDGIYKPHNCEQLALHILDFMFSRYLDERISIEKNKNWIVRKATKLANGVMNYVTMGLWDYFGNIPIVKIQEIVSKIHTDDIVKYSGEGIEVYKRITFLKN